MSGVSILNRDEYHALHLGSREHVKDWRLDLVRLRHSIAGAPKRLDKTTWPQFSRTFARTKPVEFRVKMWVMIEMARVILFAFNWLGIKYQFAIFRFSCRFCTFLWPVYYFLWLVSFLNFFFLSLFMFQLSLLQFIYSTRFTHSFLSFFQFFFFIFSSFESIFFTCISLGFTWTLFSVVTACEPLAKCFIWIWFGAKISNQDYNK